MILPALLIIALALAGLPLFCVLAALGLSGLHLSGTPLSGPLADVYSLAGAHGEWLSTIPLFTFCGCLMSRAGTGERMVAMARPLIGWVPGGLAVMTVWICAFFTVFTGASGVTIAALGPLLLRELREARYPERFCLEVITGSGSVGLLFPPALPLIVYGIVFAINAGQPGGAGAQPFSIERFLFAGILPGLLLLLILSTYCVIAGWRYRAPRSPLCLGDFRRALWRAKWEVPIPFVIILLMVRGLATIHELAPLTALYVLLVERFVYRGISSATDLLEVVRESLITVGAIFMKIAAATILTAYFIDAEVPGRLYEWLTHFLSQKWQFLLALNALLLLVGCLMDIFSAILVIVPLIVPAARQFHIDPYHLGIIFLLNLEIGYLSPPAGLNLFFSSICLKRPITELYRAVVPFVLLMFLALLMVTVFPSLTSLSVVLSGAVAP